MMKYPSFTALLFNLQVLEHWMVERPRNMEHYGNNILLIRILQQAEDLYQDVGYIPQGDVAFHSTML